MTKVREWFGEWFNSPYYHILYQHRDHEEAKHFLTNLGQVLQFKPDHRVLDVACGKGRHAIYLNSLGLEVVGIDLGPQNIQYARQFENSKLHFFVHDMREVFRESQFDVVVNLFTSFGYFDTEEENAQAIDAATTALKPGGSLVIDYLNPYRIIEKLIPQELIVLQGIEFHINRRFTDGFILKEISFKDQGKSYRFVERVRAIRKFEFMRYFVRAGLKLTGNYGDYDLNPYHWKSSKRMIFIMKKE